MHRLQILHCRPTAVFLRRAEPADRNCRIYTAGTEACYFGIDATFILTETPEQQAGDWR